MLYCKFRYYNNIGLRQSVIQWLTGSVEQRSIYTDSVYVDLGIHTFSSIGENASCIAFQGLWLRLGLAKRLGFMSGITLPAVIRQGTTPETDSEYAECYCTSDNADSLK